MRTHDQLVPPKLAEATLIGAMLETKAAGLAPAARIAIGAVTGRPAPTLGRPSSVTDVQPAGREWAGHGAVQTGRAYRRRRFLARSRISSDSGVPDAIRAKVIAPIMVA
jgi:hypothetical protein